MDSSMLISPGGEIEDKRVNIKDILNILLEKTSIEQKTILSAKNIDALIKMKATNDYLKRRYGWDLRVYDVCIDEKRLNIISNKGRGRDDILNVVQAMQNPIIEKNEKTGLLR